MAAQKLFNGFFLGLFVALGVLAAGYLGANAALDVKKLDRTVTVKGLAEREFKADIVIWPIQYIVAGNELPELYANVESNNKDVLQFLVANGIARDQISLSAPGITDKTAQQYGGGPRPEFRYTASQTVTVYSPEIDKVRELMTRLSELGRKGIVITDGDYRGQTEYLFTRLNEVKPSMIEEATRNAREVAEKFAQDSDSQLGKIQQASQGQFSISDRDKNNPHIKKVRVVSTIEYYLAD